MGIEINPITLEGRVAAVDMAAIISALHAAEMVYREENNRTKALHMELLQIRLGEGNPLLMRRAAEDQLDPADALDEDTIEMLEEVR